MDNNKDINDSVQVRTKAPFSKAANHTYAVIARTGNVNKFQKQTNNERSSRDH